MPKLNAHSINPESDVAKGLDRQWRKVSVGSVRTDAAQQRSVLSRFVALTGSMCRKNDNRVSPKIKDVKNAPRKSRAHFKGAFIN